MDRELIWGLILELRIGMSFLEGSTCTIYATISQLSLNVDGVASESKIPRVALNL